MSFLAFPPEVNSGLMYMGPGSASLAAAASAWNGLAADLSATSTGVSQVVSNLTGAWQGPSMSRATAAVAPYSTWLTDTSILAEQLSAQATAQAGLYETAHAAMIPPPVIAANRAQLLTLVATNFFGQNSPAIAANEAMYASFWADDGAAMDSYMAASQNNMAALPKPTNPPPANSGTTGQEGTATQANSLAARSMDAANPLSSGDGNVGGSTGGGNAPGAGNGGGGAVDPALAGFTQYASMAAIPARFAMYPLSMLMRLFMSGASMGSKGAAGASLAGQETMMTAIGQFVDGKLGGAVGTLANHFSSATNAISAKLANASSMGALRVPEAWSAAASGVTRAAPVLPNAAAASGPAMSGSGFPGGPFGQAMMGALSGRGMGSIAAKVPKVVPRPSAGG